MTGEDRKKSGLRHILDQMTVMRHVNSSTNTLHNPTKEITILIAF